MLELGDKFFELVFACYSFEFKDFEGSIFAVNRVLESPKQDGLEASIKDR